MSLNRAKEIEVTDVDGEKYAYVIGRFSPLSGREIFSLYPLANAPKIGDYDKSEKGMLLLMKHVERVTPDGNIRLETRALVDNHVPDAEALIRLEIAVLKYNLSFLGDKDGVMVGSWIKALSSGFIKQVVGILGSIESKAPKSEREVG